MVMSDAIRAPLFVPADRPDIFAKAPRSGTDAIILDLEDAVSRNNKEAARAALTCDFTELPVIVRINPPYTPWHAADLASVASLPVAGLMLPKSEDPALITDLAETLGPDVALLALIESAAGLAAARDIAAVPGVTHLVFGSIDFCADIGAAHQREVLLPARSELVLAARLAGICAPIDGVTAQLDDLTETQADAAHARALGMSGKLCIHPRQVGEVQRAFAPSANEIHWAKRVLASGDGATTVDGAMVDEPVRLRARAILGALATAGSHPSAQSERKSEHEGTRACQTRD